MDERDQQKSPVGSQYRSASKLLGFFPSRSRPPSIRAAIRLPASRIGPCRRPGFRTAAIGRRENRRLWRGRARHRGVSASGTPRHSPKTRGMAGNSPPDRAPGTDSPESRTTWRSEWNSNFQYSLWGESEANPNRQTWQQRQTRPAARYRPGTRRLRFGFGCAPLPRPRESAGVSGMVAGSGCKVSATAD